MTENHNVHRSTFLYVTGIRVALPVGFVGSGIPEDMRGTIIGMLAIALVAFLVCGAFLVSFWRSLAEESDRGELRFTSRSRRRLLALIASLLVFGVIFAILAYRAP